MQIFDVVRLITTKLDECPLCKNKLNQKNQYESECPNCQLRIRVSTAKSRLPENLFMAGTYSFMAGFIAFFIIDILVRH